MKNNKLKRRLWLTTMLVFITYTSILFINPSICLSLLPIIIPTGIVTIGMPSKSIYDNIKEKKKEKEKNIENTEYNIENTINKKEKILSTFETNITNDIFYETKEKNKVKTKGTIYH